MIDDDPEEDAKEVELGRDVEGGNEVEGGNDVGLAEGVVEAGMVVAL